MRRWDTQWVLVLSLGLGACSEDPIQVSEPTSTGDTGATDDAPLDDTAAGQCGNGVVEPGEDCDDPNGDPLDGCLDDCRFGPTGFAPGAPLATATRGANQGETFDDACPPGQTLIGVEGRVGEMSGEFRKLRGVCGELELRHQDGAFVVEVKQAEVLPNHGADFEDNAESFCPEDQIVVGFEGRAEPDVITMLRMHCAPLVVVDTGSTFELELITLSRSDAMGGTELGADFSAATCGDGAAALETNMRASDRIHGFGLDCAPLALVLGP